MFLKLARAICRARPIAGVWDIAVSDKELPIFAALRAKMAWISERQKLLSENIANADTPGYRPRDLKQVDFRALLEKQTSSVGVTLTNRRHLGGGVAQNYNFKPVESEAGEVSPSGNAVSLEEEMMKVGQSQMEFELTTSLYRKHMQLLKLALGRTG